MNNNSIIGHPSGATRSAEARARVELEEELKSRTGLIKFVLSELNTFWLEWLADIVDTGCIDMNDEEFMVKFIEKGNPQDIHKVLWGGSEVKCSTYRDTVKDYGFFTKVQKEWMKEAWYKSLAVLVSGLPMIEAWENRKAQSLRINEVYFLGKKGFTELIHLMEFDPSLLKLNHELLGNNNVCKIIEEIMGEGLWLVGNSIGTTFLRWERIPFLARNILSRFRPLCSVDIADSRYLKNTMTAKWELIERTTEGALIKGVSNVNTYENSYWRCRKPDHEKWQLPDPEVRLLILPQETKDRKKEGSIISVSCEVNSVLAGIREMYNLPPDFKKFGKEV